MSKSLIDSNCRQYISLLLLVSLCTLGGTANAQSTTYSLDFNDATEGPAGGVDVVALAESSTTGSAELQDSGLSGVSAWFKTRAYKLAGINEWGRVSSLVLDAALNSGASGEEGDHALSLTVGEGSAAYYADVIMDIEGWELDSENPLDAVVSVDIKAGYEDAVCVRVETGVWDDFGPNHTLGSRRQFLLGSEEWQTLSFTLSEGKTWSFHNYLDVATGLPLRVIVEFQDARPGEKLIDNVRIENINRLSE